MAAQAAPPAQLPFLPSPLHYLTYYSMLLMVFVMFSRASEFPGITILRLVAATFLPAILLGLLTGSFQRAFETRVGKLILALTIWMVLVFPFGVWRSGSLYLLRDYWSRSLLLFIVVAGTVFTFGQFRLLMRTFTCAVLVMTVYSLLSGSTDSGRLELRAGFFANPNDLATMLVIALPLFWAVAKTADHSVGKVIVLSSTVLLWLALMKTGSRGGFVGLVVMGVALFFYAPMTRKLGLLVVAFIIGTAAVAILPARLINRYFSFTEKVQVVDAETVEEPTDDIYAVSSVRSRLVMLRHGVYLTATHPLTGVGAGNFRVASTDLFKQAGFWAPWTDAHNVFLQISSENGLPALGIYIALIVVCWRHLGRIHAAHRHRVSPESQKLAHYAAYTRLALVAFVACGSFGNYAYQQHLPILAALIVVMDRVSSSLLAAEPAKAPELRMPAPLPAPRRA